MSWQQIPDEFEQQTIYTDQVTVHLIDGVVGGRPFAVDGVAKRSPSDIQDDNVGSLLAMGRAYTKLGRALTKAGYKRSQILCQARSEYEQALEEEKARYRAEREHRRPSELEIAALKNPEFRTAVLEYKKGDRSKMTPRKKSSKK